MIVALEDIVPGAIYQGETFTQTVIVQLQNGTYLRIADPTMRCSKNQIGTDVEISISADIAESVKVKDNDTVELEPVDPERIRY